MYEKSLLPDLEDTFKHALTHEVACGSVLQERRKALHRRIMESIERLYADRLAEQIERLAHHALRGEVWDNAQRYYRLAAERALGRSANREAWSHLEQSIAVLPHLEQTKATLEQAIDLRLAARTCLAGLVEFARWLEVAREAEPLADALDDARRSTLVHCSVSAASSNMVGDVGREPEQISARLVQSSGDGVFQEASTRVSYVQSQTVAAWCFVEIGEFDQAIMLAERAAKFNQALDMLTQRAVAEATVGYILLRKGDFQQTVLIAQRWLRTRNEEPGTRGEVPILGPVRKRCRFEPGPPTGEPWRGPPGSSSR